MAKPSRGFPLQCHLFIALVFERSAVAKRARGFPLLSPTVGSRGQPLNYYMFSWDTQLLESQSKGNKKLPEDLVLISA